jgi:hypothetical protein
MFKQEGEGDGGVVVLDSVFAMIPLDSDLIRFLFF